MYGRKIRHFSLAWLGIRSIKPPAKNYFQRINVNNLIVDDWFIRVRVGVIPRNPSSLVLFSRIRVIILSRVTKITCTWKLFGWLECRLKTLQSHRAIACVQLLPPPELKILLMGKGRGCTQANKVIPRSAREGKKTRHMIQLTFRLNVWWFGAFKSLVLLWRKLEPPWRRFCRGAFPQIAVGFSTKSSHIKNIVLWGKRYLRFLCCHMSPD